jgi:integrase/recombinase XerD
LSLKCVSPHSIRHTTAVHLLRSGVDINTIRAWLGHVSLDTTHVYAEVDLEMKASALANVDIKGLPQAPPRRTQMLQSASESAPIQWLDSLRNINATAT